MPQKHMSTIFCFLSIATINLAETTGLPKISEPLHKATPLQVEHPPVTRGELTVICGAMCAGKSEELIRLVGRYRFSGRKVLAIKPQVDNRKLLDNNKDPLTIIPSRNGSWIDCTPTTDIDNMEKIIKASDAEIIAIDEAHFFTPQQEKLIKLIQTLVASKKIVIVAGLELDFRAEPFGPMPKLLALADHIEKLPAICKVCGTDTFCLSQRLVNGQPAHYNDPLIVVGAEEQYEARCRNCHKVRND